MPHFFLILFKINIVLILFAMAYYLVLRRLTFYVINRLFLIFGIIFSSAYPFINLTELFANNQSLPAFVPQLNQGVRQIVQQDDISMCWQVLTILFYLGVILMAFRLILQFVSLNSMHQKSKPGQLKNIKVRLLDDQVSPFSFWQAIYINPGLHKPQDLSNILEHEKIHIEEWHTLDIILAEICVVFYWFNPGVWLMKKAVRENIEFITDAKILNKGIDKKAYQYSLLDVGALQASVSIVNNFNLSDLKKRIKMMNAKRSSKINLTRYVFVLPVLLMVTLAFTINKKDVQSGLMPVKDIVKNVLPQSKSQPVIDKPLMKKITVNRKAKTGTKLSTDAIKHFTFVFKTNLETEDTTRQSIADGLNKLAGKVKILSFKMNGNVGEKETMRHFILKDSLKFDSNLNNVVVTSFQNTDLSSSEEPKKGTIKQIVIIRTTDQKPDVKNGIVKELAGKRLIANARYNFVLNGNQLSKEEIDKIDPGKISDIKVSKNDITSFQFTTEQ